VDVADVHYRILQMGRDHLEIIRIESDELEELHPIFSRQRLVIDRS
jgi:hypothetical protein